MSRKEEPYKYTAAYQAFSPQSKKKKVIYIHPIKFFLQLAQQQPHKKKFRIEHPINHICMK